MVGGGREAVLRAHWGTIYISIWKEIDSGVLSLCVL
jgi:hypothetical protein